MPGDDLVAADCFNRGVEIGFSTLALRPPPSSALGFGLVISLIGTLTPG